MLLRPHPRILLRSRASSTNATTFSSSPCNQYATAATATVATPSPTVDRFHGAPTAIQRHPPTQPPSHKSPLMRKAQLHRQYTSILRSTPLILVFQHNNLRATEWAGIRRELGLALRKASSANPSAPSTEDLAASIRLQVIHSAVFSDALRVVEFYKIPQTPGSAAATDPIHATKQHTAEPSHGLSHAAHRATRVRAGRGEPSNPHAKRNTPLHALLSGPIAVVAFPSVDPSLLGTALKILAPTSGASSQFAAPRRRDNPGLYEAPVQNGLQKLMLLGARVEGRTMDTAGVKWVGGLEPLETMQARLVALLTGLGVSVTGVLEGAGRSLWIGLESRRRVMEEEANASVDVKP